MSRLIIAALLLVACGGQGGDPGSFSIASGLQLRPIPVAEREPAPSFSEPLLIGEGTITQEIYAGKVAVVNFWGSWCGPCRREMPLFEALWKTYGPQGVQFVGMDVRRDQRAAAIAFMEEFNVTYPSGYDPDSSVAHAFGVRVMPATFVIDKQGRIAARALGAVTDEVAFRKILDAELA
jgi:thiol-disulfide isomerase/thioredoxin